MCTCSSCRYTDSFSDKGFDAWPRGEPAGKRSSEAAYRAHVAHSYYGAKKREAVGPAGAGFYGTPAGMTKADVERVLRETFAKAEATEKAREASETVGNSSVSLLHLARELRRRRRDEAAQERRAA